MKLFTEVTTMPRSKRRGAFAQQRRLDMERSVKMAAVGFLRWGRFAGVGSGEIANLLSLVPSTLAAWRREWLAHH